MTKRKLGYGNDVETLDIEIAVEAERVRRANAWLEVDALRAEVERLRTALTEAAEEWHAPSCDADAGGACILHAEEKEAWIAAKLGRPSGA